MFAIFQLEGLHPRWTNVVEYSRRPDTTFLSNSHCIGTDLKSMIVDDAATPFVGGLEFTDFPWVTQIDVTDDRYLNAL